MRRTYVFVAIVLTALLAVALASAWLLNSETGLRWVVQMLAPRTLTIEDLHGRLLGPIEARGITYREIDSQVRIENVTLDWRPRALLRGTLHIQRLDVLNVEVRQRASTEDGGESLRLIAPLAIEVDALELAPLRVAIGDGKPVVITRIGLSGSMLGSRLTLARAEIEAEDFALQSGGTVSLAPPYALDLHTDWSLRPGTVAPLAGSGTLHGDTRALVIKQTTRDPWGASIEATLNDITGELRWRARLTSESMNAARWVSGWPEVALRTAIEAEGDSSSARATGTAGIGYGRQQLAAGFRLSAAINEVRVEELIVTEPTSEARLRASGAWRPKTAEPITVTADWRALRWAPNERASVESPRGELSASGSLDRYRITVTASVRASTVGTVELTGHGLGNRDALDDLSIQATWLDGKFDASGRVAWAPTPAWQLNLHGRDLDPGVLYAEWPGRLTLRARSQGQYAKQLQASLDIAEFAGPVRGETWRLTGGVALEGEHYRFDRLALAAGASSATLDGEIAQRWRLSWQLSVNDFSKLLPRAAGALSSSGTIEGTRAQPHVHAQIKASELAYGNDALGALAAEIDLDLTDTRTSQARLQLDGLKVRGFTADNLIFSAGGRFSDHRIDLTAKREGLDADVALVGAWRDARWTGVLQDVGLATVHAGQWRSAQSARLSIARTDFELDESCLRQGSRQLCARGGWRARSGWQFAAKAEALPLTLLDPWLPADATLEGELNGTATIRVAEDAALTGELALALGRSTWTVGDGKRRETVLALESAQLHARSTQDRIDARGDLQLASNAGQARAELSFPYAPFRAVRALERSLRGTLDAAIPDIGAFARLVPQLVQPRGRLRLAATLAGDADTPQIRGEASLEDASTGIMALGITLRDIAVQARSDGGRHVSLEAHARSGDGDIKLDGDLDFAGEDRWRAQLTVRGQGVEAVRTAQYHLIGSPDLQIRLRPRALDIEGTVFIDRASIAPYGLRRSAQHSPDVVIVGETVRERPWKVTSKIRTVLSKQVRVSTPDFKVEVEGDVTVMDEPGNPTRATGELRVTTGTYRIYGRDLNVERGRLTFTGGPVDDPEIDVRAARRVQSVTAGVQVRGRMKRPEITLFSEPTLGQTDILSYIVFGTAAQESGEDESAWLSQTLTALTVAGGEHAARGVGGAVGIEDVYIDTSATGSASVVLGTYLSPGLYVSYGMGLFETGNSLRLRYDITDRWQLETNSGEYTGIDLLYKFER